MTASDGQDAFAGRRVVVTGGSRGIGRATALAFARAGALVGITYAHSREDAEEALAALAATGASAHAVQADVADAAQVARMFDELRTALGGPVEILVNNAAVTHDALLMMLSESAWDRVLPSATITSRRPAPNHGTRRTCQPPSPADSRAGW